ncbi:MAG: Holliday junction branch migration protein RuvA [Clostridia bacterium]|nr:Holliday junction branch migration protein RuvA [Clostridia bacterium]
MYAYLDGKISEIGAEALAIDVNGVGYEVYCDLFTLSSVKAGDSIKLYTYLSVKEDSMTLFGFKEKSFKDMFITLIGVNGVGPKVAIKTLSVMKPEGIALAVMSDNAKAFKGVSGLGAKTASRIILELKGKMGKITDSELAGAFSASSQTANTPLGNVKDAIDALMGLGYSYTEASDIVKKVNKEGMSVEDIIGAALKVGR